MNLNYFRKIISRGHIWPSIEFELEEYKHLLKGKVLNAGAGVRDFSHLVKGELINQDIQWENDERNNINFFSPLDKIPVEEDYFDVIVCIAVLEHVENPVKVMKEFFRVMKPNGNLILSIPFLQPEHKVPTDFQRYTKDGLINLIEKNGFKLLEIKPVFTVYHTLYWIVYEWLNIKNTFYYKILRILILIPLGIAAKKSTLKSEKIASAFNVLAIKNK